MCVGVWMYTCMAERHGRQFPLVSVYVGVYACNERGETRSTGSVCKMCAYAGMHVRGTDLVDSFGVNASVIRPIGVYLTPEP